MPDFKGSKCIVCGKAFTSDDDIVVCPECGTPYHRECYMQTGECVNEELHKKGAEWTPDSVKAPVLQKRICMRCHAENPDGSLYCNKCGMPFNITTYNASGRINPPPQNANDPNVFHGDFYGSGSGNYDGFEGRDSFGNTFTAYTINFSDPLCGFNPSEKYSDNVNLAELGAYVDKNTLYYLPKFKFMKETGRFSSLNLSALIFPQFYFAYRKMPAMSLFSLIVILVTSAPRFLETAYQAGIKTGFLGEIISMFDMRGTAFSALLAVSYIAHMLFRITVAVRANKMYFDRCMKKIPKVKATVPENITLAALHHSGGTSAGFLALMISIYFIISGIISLLVSSAISF